MLGTVGGCWGVFGDYLGSVWVLLGSVRGLLGDCLGIVGGKLNKKAPLCVLWMCSLCVRFSSVCVFCVFCERPPSP